MLRILSHVTFGLVVGSTLVWIAVYNGCSIGAAVLVVAGSAHLGAVLREAGWRVA